MKQKLLNKFWLRVGMIVAVMTTALAGTAWAATGTLVSNLSDITEGTYYIAALNSSNYYTVPNTTISGQTFTCTQGTFSNNTLTPATGAGEFVFTAVSDVNNAYYIYNTNLNKYLVATGSKTFGYVDNTSTDYGYWTFSEVTSGGFSGVFSVKHSNKTHYMRAYSNSVRCYDGASNNGVYLFKKVESASTVVTPTFSPAAGAYTSAQSVTISTTTTGATIYYTTDGTAPTTSSTLYNGAISVSTTTTIKAIAAKSGMTTSDVAEATYTILAHAGTATDPYTIADAREAIDANTGISGVFVAGIISQVDSYNSQYNSITYWISDDGTTTDQLEVYSGKGLDNTNFTSVNDVAVGATVVVYGTLKKFNETYEFDKNNYLTSYTAPVATVEAPTFNPVAGTYAETQSVTLSTTTTGATIYYTTDGTDPTSASTEYTNAISVTTATTIKAIAVKGTDQSTVATATYFICSAENPYTVTEALAFNEYPANGIYVSGIVSTAPTQAPTSNGELTYYISVDGEATNQLEVYKGKGLEQAAFTAQDDIKVGDIVTIYGNVQVYNSTIEFGSGNYLVSFERPTSTEPSVEVSATSIEAPAAGADGTITVTYNNLTDVLAEVQFVEADGTTSATYDWVVADINASNNVEYIVDENTSTEARTAYMKVYAIGNEGEAYSDLITVTQAAPVVDYATLPFEWEGGTKSALEALAGVTANGLGSDYAESNAPYRVKFDNTGDYIQIKTNERPGIVNIGVKMLGGADASSITVKESADGETFTDLQTLSINGSQNDVLTLATTTAFAETSRYVRLYFTKGSNVGVGPISIAQYADIVLSDYTLAIANSANVTITATYGEEVLTNGNNAEVTQGTEVTLAITPASGYDFESLTIAGAEEGQTVTPSESNGVYTFTMPAYDVTVSATVTEHVESVTNTYTLATAITSGKHYVIASADGTKVMSTQNKNNRRAVNATPSADGTTIEVDPTLGVREVVIYGPDANGNYTIYDGASGGGYLYAASSSDNYLKSQATIDANGQWSINIYNGIATIVAQGTNTNKYMRYNSSNTLFSCYSSSSKMQDISLYEKADEATPTETRTLNSEGYATYASQNAFDLTNAQGFTAWAVSSVDGTAITFGQYEGLIPSGTGILLKGEAGATVTLTSATGVEVVPELPVNNLEGITSQKTITDDQYYGLSGKTFVKVNGGNVPAGRALLPVSVVNGEVKALTFNFDEDATAIKAIENGQLTTDGVIYNVAGQRLSKMQKGINIVNGRKVLY